MDKKRKDKIIGIIGLLLSFVMLASFKIFDYYHIVIFEKRLDGLILFIITLWGASLSMRYFRQLFGNKK
jgi:hypothetical protein